MTQANPPEDVPAREKPAKDRRIKLIMAVVLLAAVVGVYLAQLQPPKLGTNWATDLEQTLQQARRERRFVLVLFRSDPPNDATSWLVRNSLGHSIVTRALESGKQLCVSVQVDRTLASELARKYRLKDLPTVMTLTPDGAVLERESGRVGPATVQAMLAKAAPSRSQQQ